MKTSLLVSTLITAALAGTAQGAPEIHATAPVAMDKSWLGFTMRTDYSNPTATRAITAPVVRKSVNAFSSERTELRSDQELAANFKGYGVKVDAAASGAKRFAMFRVYKISHIEELDMTAAKFKKDAVGYVPTRVYYGWAMYVLAESDTSSFSAAASARIFGVGANVKAQASQWGATTTVALRGLDTKTPGEIVVPSGADDVANKFQVSNGPAQPILVDYTAVGGPKSEDIVWKSFVEPTYERFDAKSNIRVYRDPRVAPGTLRMRAWNHHGSDHCVWEIFKRGDWNHTYQWRQGPKSFIETTVPVPTWAMNVVWVGHVTREWNPTLDAQSGWTVDLERIP